MKDEVARTKIVMKSPDGNSKPIHVEIGRPYSISSHDSACPVSMKGLYPDIRDIHGTDTLQALALALEFVRITIRKWEEKGFAFEFPEGGALPPEIWFEHRNE